MKAYQQKLKAYHNKHRLLEVDKEALKNDRHQLEREVSNLRRQLDTISITSRNSHHKIISHSCSSLQDLATVSEAIKCS